MRKGLLFGRRRWLCSRAQDEDYRSSSHSKPKYAQARNQVDHVNRALGEDVAPGEFEREEIHGAKMRNCRFKSLSKNLDPGEIERILS